MESKPALFTNIKGCSTYSLLSEYLRTIISDSMSHTYNRDLLTSALMCAGQATAIIVPNGEYCIYPPSVKEPF